jgi:hypothetical protein
VHTVTEAELVEDAKGQIRKAIRKEQATAAVRQLIDQLDLVPVRLYIPAGDSYAAVEIRRWFRRRTGQALGYKDVLRVAPDERNEANLIILGSRSSFPLLANFQKTTHELKIRLTDTGIRFFNKTLDDVSGQHGFRLARVIVTSWILDTQNAHTYIVSNHTRAIEAVAKLLVNDESLGQVANAILRSGGQIPPRFQLAFEVRLERHEGHAMIPTLLPELNGRAVIYDDEEK